MSANIIVGRTNHKVLSCYDASFYIIDLSYNSVQGALKEIYLSCCIFLTIVTKQWMLQFVLYESLCNRLSNQLFSSEMEGKWYGVCGDISCSSVPQSPCLKHFWKIFVLVRGPPNYLKNLFCVNRVNVLWISELLLHVQTCFQPFLYHIPKFKLCLKSSKKYGCWKSDPIFTVSQT